VRWVQQLQGRYALALVFGLMFCAWWMLKADFPSTHALVDDWYNHAKYFLVFIAGFLLARQDLWWQQLVANRRLWLVIALCCYCLIIAERNDVFAVSAQFDTSVWVKTLFGVVLIANHWVWLLAMLGYAGAYLAKTNSPLLKYCNDAVLPWYILHQTLIILFAAWLKPLAIPAVAEFPLLLVLTVAGCWLGYELIRRVALLRWCFGVGKARQMKENSVSSELLPASDSVR
jgi:glucan biosynthesis protein C